MRKCIVTGGCGFIGSNLVKTLVDSGWQVTVVDDLSAGKLENLHQKVKFRTVLPEMIHSFSQNEKLQPGQVMVITGDFVHPDVIYHMQVTGFTHVFHLAANPRVEFTVKYPVSTTEANVQKSVELLTACKNTGVKKFIFASSSSVYGAPRWLPLTEEDSDCHKTQSPYGLQKKVMEDYMELYSRLYGMRGVALRFANVYGPNSDGNSPYSTAIGAWCNALKKGMPLRSDGDGEQTRDMIYVQDVVNAMILSAEMELENNFYVFNVGTGVSYSNNEILQKFRNFVGNFEVQSAPERLGDVKHTRLYTKKILKELDWKPTVDIDEGIQKTLQWWDIPSKISNL